MHYLCTECNRSALYQRATKMKPIPGASCDGRKVTSFLEFRWAEFKCQPEVRAHVETVRRKRECQMQGRNLGSI